MSDAVRILLVVGLLAFVGGGAVSGWGAYRRATDPCESGYGFTITELNESETPSPRADPVDYDDLSETDQRTFREFLTAESTPIYPNESSIENLTNKVVTYRGQRYETSPAFVADCAGGWGRYVVFGGIVAGLGGIVVAIGAGWRLLR